VQREAPLTLDLRHVVSRAPVATTGNNPLVPGERLNGQVRVSTPIPYHE
jgi:hypothetical protein